VFYTSLALALALTVFGGFARTYYLKGVFGGPALSPLVHLHGFLFTTWLLLFVTQTGLVAARRTNVHRRLGLLGAALAAVMVPVGIATAIGAAARGATVPRVDPRSFMAVPLADMVLFSAFVVLGLSLRRRSEAHKRLMVLAMLSILTAAIARLPLGFIAAGGVLGFFALTDAFLLAGVAYDLWSRGRVHPVYIWGGLLLVASQPLRLVISGTSAWLAFADWLLR
jgi:hypothetical protein